MKNTLTSSVPSTCFYYDIFTCLFLIWITLLSQKNTPSDKSLTIDDCLYHPILWDFDATSLPKDFNTHVKFEVLASINSARRHAEMDFFLTSLGIIAIFTHLNSVAVVRIQRVLKCNPVPLRQIFCTFHRFFPMRHQMKDPCYKPYCDK